MFYIFFPKVFIFSHAGLTAAGDTCIAVFPKLLIEHIVYNLFYLFQILENHYVSENISQAYWSMQSSVTGYDVNDPQAKVPAWQLSTSFSKPFAQHTCQLKFPHFIHHLCFNCYIDIFCWSCKWQVVKEIVQPIQKIQAWSILHHVGN